MIFPRSQFATLNDEQENLTSQFAISSDEKILKSQIAISSWGGTRKLPYAFTENGIAMLSSVLRSPIAIATNIQIMRAFTAMRRFIAANAQVFQRLEVISYEMAVHDKRYSAEFLQITSEIDTIYSRIIERLKTTLVIYDSLEESEKQKLLLPMFNMECLLAFEKNKVWFMINQFYGKYFINIYYDNEYNKADGEDL